MGAYEYHFSLGGDGPVAASAVVLADSLRQAKDKLVGELDEYQEANGEDGSFLLADTRGLQVRVRVSPDAVNDSKNWSRGKPVLKAR